MKLFRKVSGERVDVVKHTLEIIKNEPSVEIHIGTDSQNNGEVTTYCTVIAFRYGLRGVHYIYFKKDLERVRDRFTRLFHEAEMTIETAEWFKSKMSSVRVELDFDFNPDENHFSHKLVGSATGWAASLGFTYNIKPHKQIATKAADKHCRTPTLPWSVRREMRKDYKKTKKLVKK